MDLRLALNRTTLSAEGFAAEFGDEPQTWTVREVFEHQFANKKEALIRFDEHPWAVTLNKARVESLWYGFGTRNAEEFYGKQVRLTWGPSTNEKGPCKTIIFEPLPDEPAKKGPAKSWRPDQGGDSM